MISARVDQAGKEMKQAEAAKADNQMLGRQIASLEVAARTMESLGGIPSRTAPSNSKKADIPNWCSVHKHKQQSEPSSQQLATLLFTERVATQWPLQEFGSRTSAMCGSETNYM